MPAQVCVGAVAETSSGFNRVVVALLIMRRIVSPIPIGRTPGFLSSGISLPATKALRYFGFTSDVLSFFAKSANASHSSAGFFLNCFEQSILCQRSASPPDGPAAPFTFFAALKILKASNLGHLFSPNQEENSIFRAITFYGNSCLRRRVWLRKFVFHA